MDLSEWSALVVLGTVTSFTPGPNTTLSTAIAANQGWRRAMRFVLAVPVGWGLLLGSCSLGLGSLVLAWPALRWGILGGGVVYLCWLAGRLWRTATLNVAQDRLNVSFVQGVLLQFLNIKAWMLALSVVAGWIAGQPDALWRFAQVLPLMLGFAFFSNLTYALTGALLRQWLSQGQRLRWFNRCMSGALLMTAVWMVQSARGVH